MGELNSTFNLYGNEVLYSCGVTWKNRHFIFGGYENKRQVLEVQDCGLTYIGSTPFDFRYGACGSSGGVIVLCFDYYDYKQCRQASSPSGPWTEMPLSANAHRLTSIAPSPGNDERLVGFLKIVNFRWLSGRRLL